MSYAIVRNEKLTRSEINGKCTHNDRKAKNHSNKDIDPTRTHLNYYIKKNNYTYTKEFDNYIKENNIQGHLRSNSIVMCQMIFTSDQAFFDRIGEEETKRYFNECYKFICNYKNLGEKNIISAVVHLDEGAPHMHLIFVPVVHTKDKDGKDIDKICARDFWKGRDSYRKLQDAYFKHVKEKGFDLERGMFVEDTNREHYTIEKYKKITNYENTKKVINDIKLELPKVPEIKDIKKIVINRDEKIVNQIIKPKEELIQKLYNENISLYKELSKQANIVDIASTLEKKQAKMLEDNANLNFKCHKLEEYIQNTEIEFQNRLIQKANDLENDYKTKIKELEDDKYLLNKMVYLLQLAVKNLIKWVYKKFAYTSEKDVILDFEEETHCSLDIEKQIEIHEFGIDKQNNNYYDDLSI